MVSTRFLKSVMAALSGTFLTRAPNSLALVMVMVVSRSSVSVSIKERMAFLDVSPMLAPALLMTS